MYFEFEKKAPRKPTETHTESAFLLSTLANYEVREISPRQVAAWLNKQRRRTG